MWNDQGLYQHWRCAQAGRLYDVKFHTRDETSKDEKQHDAVDKSTSKQQVCISDGRCLCYAKNWSHTPSASGSYGRQAGRPADGTLVLKKIKSYNSTSTTFLDI